jgi:hypothetical protein
VSTYPSIFIEKCIFSATNALIIPYVENGSLGWTVYADVSSCIVVGGFFWTGSQTLLHSLVV